MKIIRSPDKLAPSKNNGSRPTSNRSDNSRPTSRKNDGNIEVDGFVADGIEQAKKSKKSKGKNLSKSQKLAKSGKKLSKIENLSNFDDTKAGPNFLNLGTRETFNHLWLAFTKAPIL